MTLTLYMAQRLSAMVMVPLVLVHLGTMIYAIQGGLTTAEILGRTQGSIWWFLFYGTFVAAASLHAAIGLRTIVSETLGLRGIGLSLFAWGFGLSVLFLGARAVWAVTMPWS